MFYTFRLLLISRSENLSGYYLVKFDGFGEYIYSSESKLAKLLFFISGKIEKTVRRLFGRPVKNTLANHRI